MSEMQRGNNMASKLEELIAEYCPYGVEFKKIGEVCEVLTGGEAPADSIKSKEPTADYIYPIYSNGIGENALWGFSKAYRVDRACVTFSSIGTIGYPTIRKANFTPIIRLKAIYPLDEEKLNLSFLKYALEIVEFDQQKSSVPNINANMIKNILIPVPPLPVQNEIVRILDNFTELTARKKQYEYYRNALLAEGEEVMLSDVASYVKERIDASAVTEETYVGVDNLLQNRAGKKISEHIPTEGKVAGYKAGDVLIGNIRPYLKKIWFADCDGGTNGDVLVIRSDDVKRITPQFLYHILSSDAFFSYDTSNSKGAKMPRGDKDAVMKYRFSLPSIEEQNRIVSILDHFDILCNDLSSGLPAEIEARQKQYEYYRDKLLSFEPLSDE